MEWSPDEKSAMFTSSTSVHSLDQHRAAGTASVIACLRMPPVGMRSLFLGDILFDEREEVIVEIRVLNRLTFHDAEDLGGTGRHRNRCGPDSRARRLLHFLQPAFLPARGNEHDARSVTVIGARGLQT